MTIRKRSAEPASGRRPVLCLVVPIPPRASPRACLEAQVGFLIDLLDRMDPDPDLEPSVGAAYPGGAYACDAEGDDCDRELSGDEDEPLLGSLDRAVDQRRWSECKASNGGGELELDRADCEPNLGSLDGVDQRHWSRGDRRDREVEVRL